MEAKKTSRTVLHAAGYTTQDAQYDGRCDACDQRQKAADLRIIKQPKGKGWFRVLCKKYTCTMLYLKKIKGGVTEIGGNPIDRNDDRDF